VKEFWAGVAIADVSYANQTRTKLVFSGEANQELAAFRSRSV
jgi:hypothetical protein